MHRKGQDLPKLVAIIGGFLIMVGIILLGMATLALSGYLDVEMMIERKYLLTFALVMIVIGLLDTFSAIIIARW